MAADKGVGVAQLALAWVLATGPDIVPIVGTKTEARLAENLAAVDVALTGAELARLDELAPPGSAAGDRYPDMSGVDV